MKMRNKGKVYPSSPATSPAGDSLSVLNLLPAAILSLVIVLSLEDREVLAYMITRSIKSTNDNKKNEKKALHVHKTPLFDCECFDCYTSFWVKWDSSPNRELIHQAIEAFEESLTTGEQFKKKNKKKMKMGHRRLAGKNCVPSPDLEYDVVVVEGKVVEMKDEVNGDDPDDENEGLNSAAVAETAEEVPESQHKGLTRKVLPDVMGLFNWRLWNLWSPN